MFRIAACDDEPLFLEQLASVMGEVLAGEGIAYQLDFFSTPAELFEARRTVCYQLILLDILIGGENGLDCAQTLREMGEGADIAFITVSPEYALSSYSVYPVNYLLKPVEPDALRKLLRHCLGRRNGPTIFLPTPRGGTAALPSSDILYIEVFRHELIVHLEGKTVSCSGILDRVASSLPQGRFYRCHRSYLVNLEFVDGLERYCYLLKNGGTVPVAKNRFREAQERLISFLQ